MSLYRKYRPQTFDDLVGQEHISQTLRNALSSTPMRVAHAYLFVGPRGTGKTTSARLLAKCLNCEKGPTPNPCNECDFCLRVSNNQVTMDLVEMDAASNRGIDDAREINNTANSAPAQSRYRVYIIDEAHQLTKEAFNALLKTIEEPPPHLIFIFATTEADKIPQTILSRCQRFDFRRVTPSDIVARLQYVAQSEGLTLQPEAARLIAQIADGALRDSLTLLEQVSAFSAEEISESDVRLVLGTVSRELLLGLMDAVAQKDAAAALHLVEQATEEGVSFSQLTRDLTSYCRDLLLLTVGFEDNGALTESENARRREHAHQIGRERLTLCVEKLRLAEKEMRQSTDHRLLLELTLVHLTADIEYSNSSATPQKAVSNVAANVAQANAPRPVWKQPTIESKVEAKTEPRVAASAPPNASASNNPTPNVSTPHVSTSNVATPNLAASNLTAPNVAARDVATRESETNDVAQSVSSPQSVATTAPQETENAPLETANSPLENAARIDETATQNAVEDIEYPSEIVAPHEAEMAVDDVSSTRSEEDAPQVVASVSEESATESAPLVAKPAQKKGRRINNLDELIELWPAVLARVKRKIGVTAVAYLHDAQPVAMDEKSATVEFQKEFHYEKAKEAAGRLPFEQVVNECMATPHVLKFRLAPPVKKAAKAETAPPPDDDDADDDDPVRMALDMFGAEIVARSGEV